ncbi:MAG TPA: cupredoxin domain-containing protein [bacterium]|nr:cupredoxin domain-containing protein [bacterium]
MRGMVKVWCVAFLVAGLSLSATAAPKAQKVTLTMTDFKFTPAQVTVTAGTPVEITLVNKGKVEHEFMVYPAPKRAPEDWDEYLMPNTFFKDMGEVEVEFEGQGAVAGVSIFEVEVKPGKEATVHFTPNKKGTFEIGCHVEGHYEAGMKATLTVK